MDRYAYRANASIRAMNHAKKRDVPTDWNVFGTFADNRMKRNAMKIKIAAKMLSVRTISVWTRRNAQTIHVRKVINVCWEIVSNSHARIPDARMVRNA